MLPDWLYLILLQLGNAPLIYDYWWLALPIWLCLGWSAWVDARTGRVPDRILLPGALWSLLLLFVAAIVVSRQDILYIYPDPDLHDWMGRGTYFMTIFIGRVIAVLGFAAAIWGLNEGWYRWKKHEALGMGDAKWSAVAVLGFGLLPVLWCWGLGAILALLWLGWRRWQGHPARQVYFAPFLCIALLLVRLAGL